MTEETTVGPTALGFEPFGAAIGLALAVGLLGCLVPALVALAGALGALGVAAWAAGLPPHPWSTSDPRRVARGGALVVAAAAGVVYLDPIPLLAPSRGFLLAAGLVPLWWAERTHRAPLRTRGRSG